MPGMDDLFDDTDELLTPNRHPHLPVKTKTLPEMMSTPFSETTRTPSSTMLETTTKKIPTQTIFLRNPATTTVTSLTKKRTRPKTKKKTKNMTTTSASMTMRMMTRSPEAANRSAALSSFWS